MLIELTFLHSTHHAGKYIIIQLITLEVQNYAVSLVRQSYWHRADAVTPWGTNGISEWMWWRNTTEWENLELENCWHEWMISSFKTTILMVTLENSLKKEWMDEWLSSVCVYTCLHTYPRVNVFINDLLGCLFVLEKSTNFWVSIV